MFGIYLSTLDSSAWKLFVLGAKYGITSIDSPEAYTRPNSREALAACRGDRRAEVPHTSHDVPKPPEPAGIWKVLAKETTEKAPSVASCNFVISNISKNLTTSLASEDLHSQLQACPRHAGSCNHQARWCLKAHVLSKRKHKCEVPGPHP